MSLGFDTGDSIVNTYGPWGWEGNKWVVEFTGYATFALISPQSKHTLFNGETNRVVDCSFTFKGSAKKSLA